MSFRDLIAPQNRRYSRPKLDLDDKAARQHEESKRTKRATVMTPEEIAVARVKILAHDWWGNGKGLPHGITPLEKAEFHLKNGATRAASWIVEPDSAGSLYPGYRRWALHCNYRGWNIFPETYENGKRKPAVIRKVSTKPSTFRDKLRPFSDVAYECGYDETQYFNVALTLGAGCAHVRVIDIDTEDQDLAEQLHVLADEVLGKTPFVRVGRFPRRQLYYRCDAADEAMINVTKFTKVFLKPDGTPDIDEWDKVRNSIEFLSAGSNATIYGLHHRTGQCFDWSLGSLHPAIAEPEHAPVITKDSLIEFFERANEARPIKKTGWSSPTDPRGSAGGATTSAFVQSGDVWLPKKVEGDWTVEDGIVVDGREAFLTHVIWSICAANAHMILSTEAVRSVAEDWVASMCSARPIKGRSVEAEFNSKWSIAVQKWVSAALHFESQGEWPEHCRPYRLTQDGRKAVDIIVPSAVRPADGTLDFLPVSKAAVVEQLSKKTGTKLLTVEQTEGEIRDNREDRALIENAEDRAAERARISNDMDAAIARIIERADHYIKEPVGQAPAMILDSPTGSGKTARSIAALGAYCKEKPRQADQGPIIICLPTHANMSELLEKAQANGMTVPAPNPELTIESAEAMLRASGVKVETFKGKIAAGCLRPADIQALEDRQISSSGLCGAEVVTDSEIDAARKRRNGEKFNREEVLCVHRERGECGFFNQHDRIMQADIVLVAHHYINAPNLPKVLQNARLVVIDESITFKMLKFRVMPLSTFDLHRPEPWLTKKEKAEGIEAAEILQQRDVIAEIAEKALIKGQDPAGAIEAAGYSDYVDSAIKVCARGHGDDRQVTPILSASDVAKMVADRIQVTELIGEEKFWRLIKDRSAAKGDFDRRFQKISYTSDEKVGPVQHVRMSWRTEANWASAPVILLDASASQEIIEKVLDRPVFREIVRAKSNIRTVALLSSTYSNSSFSSDGTSRLNGEQRAKARAASRARRGGVRLLLEKLATVFGHGRGIVGSTTSVQVDLQSTPGEKWNTPPNLDWRHFGALRGLDFAKDHAFAVGIGRSEQPIMVVDAYAAALTYDDDEPQEPFDVTGSGGNSIERLSRVPTARRIQMRDGVDYEIEVPTFPSEYTWCNLIEQQWREEELLQFVGRLRPIYRDQPGVYFAVGRILPRDLVVDEIVNLQDLMSDADFYRISSACGGVMDDWLSPKNKRVAEVMAVAQQRENKAAKVQGREPETVTIGKFNAEHFKNAAYTDTIMRSKWTVRYWANGERRLAYVWGYHEDPVTALKSLAALVCVEIDEIISVEAPEFRQSAGKGGADWVADKVADRNAAWAAARAQEMHDALPELLKLPGNLSLAELTKFALRSDVDAKDAAAHVAFFDSFREVADEFYEHYLQIKATSECSSDWESEVRCLTLSALEKINTGATIESAFSPLKLFLHMPV